MNKRPLLTESQVCTSKAWVHPRASLGRLSLLAVVFSAVSVGLAQSPSVGRTMSYERWSVADCMARARWALQIEGYTIDWTGGDGYRAVKGPHSAMITCDAGPEGRTLVNIVVASNAADRNVVNSERDRLGARLGNSPTEGTGGGGRPIDWGNGVTDQRGQNGKRITFYCKPNPSGGVGSIWGTDLYTDDSSVCGAAVHAGLISKAGGGTVTVEIRPGQSTYAGTPRNGVSTSPYGQWSGSFVFVR